MKPLAQWLRLLALAGILPGLASAENLNRCVDQSGHVSYQSASCAPGQRLDRTIGYVPDAEPTPFRAVSGRSNKRLAPKSRIAIRTASIRVRKPQPSPCSRAKAKREAQLQRLGLKRTFDDLSRIDAAVRAACNGY